MTGVPDAYPPPAATPEPRSSAKSRNSDPEFRRLLHPLAAMAERTGCAVVLNRHHKKGGGPAMERGGGSIAVNAVARATLAAVRDPDDETGERRVLGIVKANLLPQAERQSLAYRIVGATVTGRGGEQIETSRIEWLGTDVRTLDDIYAVADDTGRASVTADCAAALRELLADGGVSAEEVKAALAKEEFSASAIRRAKHVVGISREAGTIYRIDWADSPWMWALEPPENA